MCVMPDFTSYLSFAPGDYGGSDEKYAVRMNGIWYMLKFDSGISQQGGDFAQVATSSISEYLGSHIFQMAGIEAHETILGTAYGRTCVACRDFMRNDPRNLVKISFHDLENANINVRQHNRLTPEFEYTLGILQSHPYLEPIRGEAIRRFWQTLCIDSLIANYDRHAGNWGYLALRDTNEPVGCMPVYDCGSSLFSLLSDAAATRILSDKDQFMKRQLERPTARLLNKQGKKMTYREVLLAPVAAPARQEMIGLDKALDLDSVKQLVYQCPGISSEKAAYLSAALDARYELFWKPALEMGSHEDAPGPAGGSSE